MGLHERRVRREVSVEWLVAWAYGEQQVERDSLGLGAAQSGTAAMLDYLRLGCRIDSSGCGARLAAAGSMVHPDALAVQRRVAGLGGLAAALLRQHGRAGTRPDWRPGARHRFVPERLAAAYGDGAGEAEVDRLPECDALADYWPRCVAMPLGLRERVEASRQWGGRGDVLQRRVTLCAVRSVDDPAAVAADRMAWRVWRDGLETLMRHWRRPGGDLSAYTVSQDLPLEAPWLDSEAVRRAGMLAAYEKGLDFPMQT